MLAACDGWCRERLRLDADESPVIYVAGPYTQPDPAENTHRIVRIADALLAAGFVPIVPHLSLVWQLVSPKPYDAWLAYDRCLIARCDAVLRVPGMSRGATQECLFAESTGIPVIYARSTVPAVCAAAVIEWLSRPLE